MPQETKAILHKTEHAPLQGSQATADDAEALRKAIDLALDYRGDITITRKSGEAIECYLFDVKREEAAVIAVRAIPKDCDEKMAIAFDDIEALTFTGRDTAAGRSFDTWMKNYVKKKLAGEEASIQSDSLE